MRISNTKRKSKDNIDGTTRKNDAHVSVSIAATHTPETTTRLDSTLKGV